MELKPVSPPKVKGESNSQTVSEYMCLCGFCRGRGEFQGEDEDWRWEGDFFLMTK